MADLELRRVVKRPGAVHVVRGVDLDVADGAFVVFVGSSGCGKSPLLRMIGGRGLTVEIKGRAAVEPGTRLDLAIDGSRFHVVGPDEAALRRA